MNPFRSTRGAFALALSAAVLTAGLAPTGCNNAERAREQARTSAKNFRSTLEALPNNVDATINQLVQLTAENNTRRGETFRDFSRELGFMENRANELGRQADIAQSNADAFFREYVSQSMASRDPAVRQAAMDNVSNRRDAVNSALSILDDGRRQYRELFANLRDIQNRLRTDLSPAAINNLSPQIQAAIRQGNDVKEYVAALDDRIDSILNIQR